MQAECEASNPGDACAQTACLIEGDFTMHFLTDFITGSISTLADPAFQTVNGFDRSSSCLKGNNNQNGGSRDCCGVHPNRAPYSAARGTHGCCGNTLFSTMSQDCCSDVSGDFVASIGTCP